MLPLFKTALMAFDAVPITLGTPRNIIKNKSIASVSFLRFLFLLLYRLIPQKE